MFLGSFLFQFDFTTMDKVISYYAEWGKHYISNMDLPQLDLTALSLDFLPF